MILKMSFLQNLNSIIDWSIQKLQWQFSESAKAHIKALTADQDFVIVVDEKNDNVTMNERIRNKINVSNIIAIDYDEFEKLCRKDDLQTFVFQYDNISAKITVMTTIFDEKNEKIKILFKYQNYADVFDETDANKLSKHRFHDYAI